MGINNLFTWDYISGMRRNGNAIVPKSPDFVVDILRIIEQLAVSA